MNIEKIKKNLEIFSRFLEYQGEFLEWVEKNKDNPDAFHNLRDSWKSPEYLISEDCDCLEEKKETPTIEFFIQYTFVDGRFPCIRILNNNNEVFRMTLEESRMECQIKDVYNIDGI